MKEIEVYFVRHGETMYNLMRKMQGWSDTPLTERGIPVLEATAQKLQNTHFDAVYSSDLKRAVDTAKIMLTANHATDTQIIESRNLREVFFGSFEGENEEETWERVGAPMVLRRSLNFGIIIHRISCVMPPKKPMYVIWQRMPRRSRCDCRRAYKRFIRPARTTHAFS
ncbi:histidine phosphatase family protein [Amylolactobacillus amylophilus]|uniref:histidine phosphatase family protein n=1 Tax=Amylolactobacillus amylophilus TaxID=1603 RepID=UPI000B2D668A